MPPSRHPADPGAAVATLVEPGRTRVLGLGEPLHGDDGVLGARNAVFRHLVEHCGFRTIALESSAWAGRCVDDHVRHGRGSEDEVMAAGFSHGFGAMRANRELVAWARRHNAEGGDVRVVGCDGAMEMMTIPSPRAALVVLHGFLPPALVPHPWETIEHLLGPDAPWEDEAAAMEPRRGVGREQRVRDLRVIADDLARTLAAEAPALRADDPGALADAELAARTATGLLAHHAAMADGVGDGGGPDDSRRWSRLGALRDATIAENVLALERDGLGPVLVFASTQHVRTGTTVLGMGPMRLRFQPAGAHLAARLGSAYRAVGISVGTVAGLGIAAPEPGTPESALAPGLYDAAALAPVFAGRPQRSAGHPSYFPLDPTVLEEVDAILHLPAL